MNGSLTELVIASSAFVGAHMIMSSAPVREPLVIRIGQWPFRGLYSLVSAGLLAWMINAFIQAPDVPLYDAYIGIKHLTFSVMAMAVFLVVFGYTTPNPTAVGMEQMGLRSGARGVLKITRHPVMWGTALWALSHMFANGHAASFVFFGAIAFLAIAGAWQIDNKRRAEGNEEWDAYMKITSHVPLVAIITGRTRVDRGEYKWWQTLLAVVLYLGLLFAHEPLVGRYILPF